MVYNVEKISSSNNNKKKEVNENDHNVYVWNSIEKSNTRTHGGRRAAVKMKDIEKSIPCNYSRKFAKPGKRSGYPNTRGT